MKKYLVWIVLLLLLTGCSGPPGELNEGMKLRSKLLQSSGCSFDTVITADYGDKIHIFSMHCKSDHQGDVIFTVTQPDTISGISGKLTGEGGDLTFEDTVLHFEWMAEEQLSPVSAPWILMKTLRSGYMTSACREDGVIRLSMDDSYEKEALRLDIWLNEDQMPERAEILYDAKRILSITVENFLIL